MCLKMWRQKGFSLNYLFVAWIMQQNHATKWNWLDFVACGRQQNLPLKTLQNKIILLWETLTHFQAICNNMFLLQSHRENPPMSSKLYSHVTWTICFFASIRTVFEDFSINIDRSSHREVFVKKEFLKIPQYSQDKTCVAVFLTKMQALRLYAFKMYYIYIYNSLYSVRRYTLIFFYKPPVFKQLVLRW